MRLTSPVESRRIPLEEVAISAAGEGSNARLAARPPPVPPAVEVTRLIVGAALWPA